MYKQTIPAAAVVFANLLVQEQIRLRRRLQPVFRRVDTSFADMAREISASVSRSQVRVAAAGQTYTDRLLGAADPGFEGLTTSPLIGVTGLGVPIEEVFSGARIMTTQESLRVGLMWGFQLTKMALADTARQSTILGMGSRQTAGYVRALVGKTCSRCAVLAGRSYNSEDAFLRHPNCDCIHVPYRSDQDASPAINVDEYFASLSEQEQDRAFTKAGAEAIRHGADVNQVVNARRGMNTVANAAGQRRLAKARIYGRDVYATTEGMTKRGMAFSSLNRNTDGLVKSAGSRYRRSGRVRLMPETIISTTKGNPEETVRMLRLHGYIFR